MEIVVENPENADSTTPLNFGGTAGPKRRRRRKVVTNRNG